MSLRNAFKPQDTWLYPNVESDLVNIKEQPQPANSTATSGNLYKLPGDAALYWKVGAAAAVDLGGAGGAVTSIGPVDGNSNVNGGDIVGNELRLAYADETFPGALSTIAQEISGLKTFNDGIETETIDSAADITLTAVGDVNAVAAELQENGARVTTTFSNVGVGTGTVFRDKTGSVANIKTLVAGTGITLNNNADDVEIVNSTSHDVVTLAAIGAVPNANAASITAGQVLNLQPADANFGGVMTTSAQTLAGQKTFNDGIITETIDSADDITLTAVSNVVIDSNLEVGVPATSTGTILLRNDGASDPIFTINGLATDGTFTTTATGLEVSSLGNVELAGGEVIVTNGVLDVGVAATATGEITLFNDTVVQPTITLNGLTQSGTITTGASGLELSAAGNVNAITTALQENGVRVIHTLAAVGATPNANGMTKTGATLNLEPADSTNPGVVTAGVQDIGGDKRFTSGTVELGVSTTTSGTLILNHDAGAFTEPVVEWAGSGGTSVVTSGGGGEFFIQASGDLELTSPFDTTITSGTGLNLTATTGSIVIDSTGGPDSIALNAGTEVNATPELQENGSRVIINGNSLGGTEAIFSTKTTNQLNFKGLTAGTGIALASDANAVTISNSTASKEILLTPEVLWNGNPIYVVDGIRSEYGFAAASDANNIVAGIPLPFDYTAGNNLTFTYYWHATPIVGSVKWDFEYGRQRPGVAVVNTGTTATQTVAVSGTADALVTSSFTIVGATLSGQPGDMLSIMISRNGTAIGDDLAAQANLTYAIITYT